MTLDDLTMGCPAMSDDPTRAATRRDTRYDEATDKEVAETILADLNYKRLPYERALIVTTAHVHNIRAAALTAARTPTATCLDSISGCMVEGFHDHPESLPPDVIAMSEEGFGDA